MDILKGLNKEQLMAVQHIDGPCLVMAGAGSGKTRVLTTRIVNLIENGVNEDDIHENILMKKNAAIIYGLLYCEGYDWLKVRIFFNLFKDKDRKLKKSEDLDYFLFMLFTTATYCTCYARNQLSKYIQYLFPD